MKLNYRKNLGIVAKKYVVLNNQLFRGTRTYQENNKGYNPAHFNNLTPGAKKIR